MLNKFWKDWQFTIGIMIPLLFVILFVNIFKKERKQNIILPIKENVVKQEDYNKHCNPHFSEENLKQLILDLNIKFPEIVLAQAKLESGNFTSRVFKENNNLFGMKVPARRNHLTIGKNLGYAIFEDWQQSVIDYALFQQTYFRGNTEQDYYNWLNRIYSIDDNYINKLKRFN